MSTTTKHQTLSDFLTDAPIGHSFTEEPTGTSRMKRYYRIVGEAKAISERATRAVLVDIVTTRHDKGRRQYATNIVRGRHVEVSHTNGYPFVSERFSVNDDVTCTATPCTRYNARALDAAHGRAMSTYAAHPQSH